MDVSASRRNQTTGHYQGSRKQTVSLAVNHPPPHLFDRWPQVEPRLASAKQWILFLDFDGTLVPIDSHPAVVKLGLSLRQTLRQLASHRGVTLYVISGRPLPELKKLVPVAGVRLLGLHGWSGSKQLSLATDRSIFQNAKQLIEQQLPRCPGLWLQDKGLGLAIHFRGATASALRSGRQVVIGVLESFKPQLHLLEGKGIWELLPHQIDGKGPAVHALLAKSSNPVLPIFVGDDTSDESAFAVVRGGLSIHVGRGHRTKARFRLRNPAEVAQFLKRLEAMRSCR